MFIIVFDKKISIKCIRKTTNMSTRQIRKYKETHKKKDNKSDVSLEDFEPGFVTKQQSAFAGLLVNSDSENEARNSEIESDNSSSEHTTKFTQKPGKQKKKKRNKHNKSKNQQIVAPAATSSTSNENPDDIAQMVAEVNMLLGEPELPAFIKEEVKEVYNPLRVQAKFFDVKEELTRRFGPDEDEERGRRQRPRVVKRLLVQPNEAYNQFKFTLKGLKMVMYKQDAAGLKYFKFEHGPEYVKNMTEFIIGLKRKYFEMDLHELHVFPNNTIEAVLENNDIFYTIAFDNGRPDIEETIYYLQGLFHPKFNLSDDKVRLEYVYMENRMFHVALLKYLHLLTNKACHRTALEVAKLLLNLDPSDPLAIILIIDMLAIRAREHKWLVELYKHWEHQRDAKHLFHMRYSHAMALFHIATKTHCEEKLEEAQKELKNAMLDFPFVVIKLLECASQKNDKITNCDLFKKAKTSECLKELMLIYAKFIWPRWMEPHVWKWFIDTATSVVNVYTEDEAFRVAQENTVNERLSLFRTYPLEIKRHLSIITPMAKLLLDGTIPNVERSMSYNPYPNEGLTIDANNYLQREATTSATIREIFNSLFPGHHHV